MTKQGSRWFAGVAFTLALAAPAWSAEEVRIGVLSPMTGPTAKFGQAQKNALTMAAEDVNAAGGIKSLGGAQIKLIWGDTRGEADTGVTETERLVTKEKAHALIGAFQSGVGLPSSAVAERYQVPWVNYGTVDKITERGFKYVFRAHAHDTIKAKTLIDGIAHLGAKAGKLETAVIVAENTEWGKSVSQKQKGFLEARGIKVLMVDNYPFAAPDLTSMLVKAKGHKPDLLIADSYLGDALLITRTMAEHELKPVVYAAGGGGHIQPDFIKGVGGLAEGLIACVNWDAGVGNVIPWIAKENERHIARFGAPFTEDSAAYYQAFYIIMDALERTKTLSSKAIRDAIAATKITDPNNKAMFIPYPELSFEESGQNPQSTAFVTQWQGGKLKILYPEAYADPTAKPIWPYPQSR